MPGIATQFEILKLTIDRLQASGNGALQQIAKVMADNSPFAHLGAIGPAFGDFIPSDPPPDPRNDPNPYALVWKMVFGLIGGDPGFLSVLTKLRSVLDTLQHIADVEDCDALDAIRHGNNPNVSLDDITNLSNELSTLVGHLNPLTTSTIPQILDVITTKLRPVVDTANTTDPVPPPDQWQVRDFLHWKHPGRFIRALLTVAKENGDDRLLAYAYGYIVSYAGNVCGNPFVNSAVGGPPRTQWWRQRYVKNFIDAWVFGFYNQDPRPMPGDNPTPPYTAWPSLCSANLHQRIELGGPALDPVALLQTVKTAHPFPAVFPNDFAALWFEAFQAAYPNPIPAGVKLASLNGAYLMTWLVLWFQTSGAVLGCDPKEPMKPPDGCDDKKDLDPFKPAPGGGPTPPPQMDTDLEDSTAKVCGIILAILGGIAVLFGAAAQGAAAIAGAAALLDCSNLVHWQKLRCELFWFRMYMFNGVKGLHKLLAIAGFDYPIASQLAEDEAVLDLIPGIQFESGRALTKSREQTKDYPSKPWDGSDLTFNQRPTASNPGFESPGTIGWYSETYPNFFVDDDINNPLGQGDVKTGPASFPVRRGGVWGDLPVQFGNAVGNAVDLFEHIDQLFPDWNLDGDRGVAYVTWEFDKFYNPDAVTIKPEP
jgi:hypothetical protein